MKFRILACFMTACCLLAGCGKNDSNSQKEMSSNPEQIGTTEPISDVSEPVDSNCSLNFSCGTITLPCPVKDLDFIGIDESTLVSSIGYIVGDITYDELPIGKIFIDEADADKELTEQTVVGLEITSLSSYEFADIKVDYKGITINDTREKLEEVLGKPDPEKSDDSWYYYLLDENNNEKHVRVDFDPFEEDKIEAIGLYVK